MQLVAKNLLTDFRDQFKGKGRTELARWAFGKKLDAWTSRNPFAVHHTGGLLEEKTQVEFFRLREERLLLAAGAHLRALTANGRMSAYEAFTAQQNELLALATAHVERLVLESFNAAIHANPDMGLRATLEKLRSLFALHRLADDRAWFLENGLLSPTRARAVTREVERLCAEVRGEAVALVDAFGIPPECLAAPIALD